MRRNLLSIAVICGSSLLLAGCGSSVNTNSNSYKDGYTTGMHNGPYSPINCDKGTVDGLGIQRDRYWTEATGGHYNWTDFQAGCKAGKRDSR